LETNTTGAGFVFLQRQDRAEDVVVRDDRAEALAGVEVAGLEAQPPDAVLAAQLQALRTRRAECRSDVGLTPALR
jgi:hypothetical protein